MVKQKYQYHDEGSKTDKNEDNTSLLKEVKEMKQLMIELLTEIKQKNN